MIDKIILWYYRELIKVEENIHKVKINSYILLDTENVWIKNS